MQLLKGFPSLTDSTSQSEKEKAVLCCGSIFSSHDPVQGRGGALSQSWLTLGELRLASIIVSY